MPLPDATQWELVEQVADSAYPIYEHLKRLGAVPNSRWSTRTTPARASCRCLVGKNLLVRRCRPSGPGAQGAAYRHALDTAGLHLMEAVVFLQDLLRTGRAPRRVDPATFPTAFIPKTLRRHLFVEMEDAAKKKRLQVDPSRSCLALRTYCFPMLQGLW
jgi:hypothetical protein